MDYEAERDRRIREIERLWKEKTGKGKRELDAAINKKFQVGDGQDALTFESMEIVEAGLLKTSEKAL